MRKLTITKAPIWPRAGVALVSLSLLVFLSGCEVANKDGNVENDITLPTELSLDLYCPEVGVAEETCILEDKNNPFARVIVNDQNKFELSEDISSAKAGFYLWGTALARSQQGENQFYTARALHQLYTEGGSTVARDQAIKAYRSLLDNFFNSFTYFGVDVPSGQVFIPLTLSEEVGKSLVTPEQFNLSMLFGSDLEARAALGEWGYSYDTELEIVTRNF